MREAYGDKKELPPKMDTLPQKEIPLRKRHEFYYEPNKDMKTLGYEEMNSNIDKPDILNSLSKNKRKK